MGVTALYSSATGMKAQFVKMDVIANNLANVNTTAYKKVRANFQDLLYQRLSPSGAVDAQNNRTPSETVVGLGVKTSLEETEKPVNLTVVGSAQIGDQEVGHEAVPAEDKMQAFLWRHLLPAETLPALVYNSSWQPPADRVRPPIPDEDRPKGVQRTLTKSSVAGALNEIERLYQEWFFTDEFANRETAAIEARVIQ